MSDFTLGQAWVTNATRDDLPDVSMIGTDLGTVPDASDLTELLRTISASEYAREMVRRKWFAPVAAKDKVLERGNALFDFLMSNSQALAPAMFKGRREATRRGLNDEIATMAWVAHVTETAKAQVKHKRFIVSNLTKDFIRSLAKASSMKDNKGPRTALGMLSEVGINVVVERGLPGMSLDGASFHHQDIGPVLALTVRHDRLDNFWFTLLHEVGHIALHLATPTDEVFLDAVEGSESSGDAEVEAEANAYAKDSLIPRDAWHRSGVVRIGDRSSVIELAKALEIHPSIVAGRIRYERRDYKIFFDLVCSDLVSSSLFER